MALTTGKRFIIRSGVPMPVIHRQGSQKKTKYPFHRMKPGDSFGFPKKLTSNVSSALGKRRVHHPEIKDWKFRILPVSETVSRCWRVK